MFRYKATIGTIFKNIYPFILWLFIFKALYLLFVFHIVYNMFLWLNLKDTSDFRDLTSLWGIITPGS